MKYLIISLISIVGLAAILLRNSTDLSFIPKLNSINEIKTVTAEKQQFNDYWYQGLAELSGYKLEQSRYGEIHEGTATMIFVTEPFSKKRQVKLDDPSNSGKDNVSVLKLNSTRKFLTGIYPYSMMTSVFSPISTSKLNSALKLTMTGQEWCGQVFSQMNLKGGKYHYKSYSYFGSEGDQELHMNKALLEDEIFNMIRMNPKTIKTGETLIIPSAVVIRFLHEDIKPYEAIISKSDSEWNGKSVGKVNISYKHNERNINIFHQKEFPFIIEGWEDEYNGLISTAHLINTKKLDYWSKHDNKDRYLNEELYK